jgi:hypothetical protein
MRMQERSWKQHPEQDRDLGLVELSYMRLDFRANLIPSGSPLPTCLSCGSNSGFPMRFPDLGYQAGYIGADQARNVWGVVPNAAVTLNRKEQLWQAGQMAKAYRTDVVSKEKFQGEIRHYKNGLKPERVQCPIAGCQCSYEMYGYTPSNRNGNTAILQERLKGEHPDHTSEVLAVNEFRKFPRQKM